VSQELAERRIKGLQKEFLNRIEEHEVYQYLKPQEFNDLRKRVFRGTFEAYRLGIIGIDNVAGPNELTKYFFNWLDDSTFLLPHDMQTEVSEMCWRAALEAFRIGAMAAAERRVA
jgi:hypothetical protein